MKNTYIKTAKITLIILIVLTLLFIFSQSMLSKEESSKESNAVGGIIAEILPPGTPVGDYVQSNLRKIAHFAEFFLLGSEVAVFVYFFVKRKPYTLFAYLFALVVALLDETVQIFSERGPAISDVWIDFFGFATAFTLLFVLPAVISFLIFKKHRTE